MPSNKGEEEAEGLQELKEVWCRGQYLDHLVSSLKDLGT